MNNKETKSRHTYATAQWSAWMLSMGLFLLCCGCCIYLLFRSRSINLYRWCQACGIAAPVDALRERMAEWHLPSFFLYSLPDGLYCASYILIAASLWKDERGWMRHVVALTIPLVAISHELLQLAGVARGTFDWADMACYAAPCLIYLSFITNNSFINH